MKKKGTEKKEAKTKKTKPAKTTEKSFIAEVKDEMKKVRWSSKSEMAKYSTATIIFIIIFGLYFFGFDIIFAWFKELVG